MSEARPVREDPGVGPELTAFQQNILVTLSEEPMYGLAIKRALEDYYGTDVNHGRLYPNLDELVEMDLVEKSELDKRTNQYALTEAGVDAIVDRLDWTFSKFVTGDDRAERVVEIVDRHR